MVLDIRKDLLQRKQKSQPKSSAASNPREGPRVQDSEAAETLAGPFSPPCSYDPLVFNLHNSLYREVQPRPLRVPCSACTFVPHNKQFLAQSRNGLHRRSHPFHHKQLPAATSHEECCTIDEEEPCAEDIAGDHQSFTVECVASIQPIKVACSACTSSLRAPLFYGHTAVAPKVKPRKRAKNPKASFTEAIATATADCPVQDLHNDHDRAAEDCGWFVRPDKGPCMSSSGSAMVRQSPQSAALEKKKSLNAVPVEVDAVHNVEIVEGHRPHESIAVTYQPTRSCENISDIVHENTELTAGEKKPYHCFVKRVAEKKSFRTVPVEVETVQSVEIVEGGSPHESIAVTYQATQSCEDISDIVPEITELAAREKKPYRHDCFVKRVERACAKVTGSKGAAADRSSLSQSCPRPSSAMSRHERRKSTANKRGSRQQQHAVSSADNDQYIGGAASVNQGEEQGAAMYEQEIVSPTGVNDNSDAVNDVNQAVSDIASISMQEKSIEKKRASRQSRQENSPSDPRKSKSGSQDDPCAAWQPRISIAGAAPSTKHDEQVNIHEGEAGVLVKKRSSSRMSLRKEYDVASQIPNLDSHSQMTKKSIKQEEGTKEKQPCTQTNKSSEHEEETKKEKPLRLSVEVFPSPSAPKGFGLKIVQHFPKTVDVEYVNGLGLSPRSFQTLPCQQCSSSACPPLKL